MRWLVRKCQSKWRLFFCLPSSVAWNRRPHVLHWLGNASYIDVTSSGLNTLRAAAEMGTFGRCAVRDVGPSDGVPACEGGCGSAFSDFSSAAVGSISGGAVTAGEAVVVLGAWFEPGLMSPAFVKDAMRSAAPFCEGAGAVWFWIAFICE